ncbi:outer membrane lipoprotein-sorting protein [Roseobacter fucihabitans]|uniref:outer membrane lipoprotein-sorting protein n=1 Tax=Roseobacter fucihabitans TaxID=1537242 RepID=UPI001652F355
MSTYAKIHLWVTSDQLVPVRADYFLTSGKLQESAWFSRSKSFSGGNFVRIMALANPAPLQRDRG